MMDSPVPELQPITPRILVTTDFSDDSLIAFYHALAVAVAKRARLTMLHTGSESRDDVAWEQFPGVRETLGEWGLLEKDAPRTAVSGQLGVDVTKMAMRDSDPRQGIADYLRRHPVDLLVMATRGRTGMARVFRPSVAETVTYRTRSHALLLPDEASGFVDVDSGVATLQRVLCVLDPYRDPRHAMAYLRSWLPAFGGVLAEVTVVDSGNGDVFDDRQLPRVDGQTWTLRRQLGPVPDVALELVDELDPDLVVITGQGRLGLRSRLAGSHAETLMRGAQRPVLIMPAV
jgi:nucleotide-binding universal stress UspA family protein